MSKKKEGLTLIELLLTVTIISILWIIMVRLFQGKIEHTKVVTCNFQVKEMNAKLDIVQSLRGRKITTQEELERILNDPAQFDVKPVCPFGWHYTLNPETGLVNYHKHK